MRRQKITEPMVRSKAKQKHSAKKAAVRKIVHNNRPLHRHIALSPLSTFALLCVGVLLATFTVKAIADSYTVTAVYDAPRLTIPAIITSPTDGTQTTTEAETVSGTCPVNSYVALIDNGNAVGYQNCIANAFAIGLDLSAGDNILQAQDYNVTNSAGPSSSSITVTYTPPPPPPPVVTPTPPVVTQTTTTPPPVIATPQELIVTQVDLGIPFIVTSVQDISYRPTFAGIAPPFSRIFIVIHSNAYTCDTTTSDQGYWSCTLPDYLPAEVHHVDVSAKTPQGATLTYPQFEVKVTGQAPQPQPTPAAFRLSTDYVYRAFVVGQEASYDIHVTGGQAPYAFTILWGDGQSSTIIRQNADDLTISHKYGWIKAISAVRNIKIQAIDTDGHASTLELSTLIRNPAYHGAVANVTKPTGLWRLFAVLQPWLWILWPGYIILILLVFSFWLGEREEMRRLMGQNRVPVVGKHHSSYLHFHR